MVPILLYEYERRIVKVIKEHFEILKEIPNWPKLGYQTIKVVL